MPQSPGVKTGPAGPPPKPARLPSAPSLKGLTGSVRAGTRLPPRPKAEALKGGIPKTFEGAPKLAKAYKAAPYEPYKPPKGGGALGFLGGAGESALAAIPNLLGSAVTRSAGPVYGQVAGAITKAVTTKGEAAAKVFVKEPGALAGRTVREVPRTLNAMLMGPAHTALEEVASVVAARNRAQGHLAPAEVLGVKPGPPGEAVKSLAKTVAGEYVGPHARYGKSLAAEEKELKTRGLTPELTDLAIAAGGGLGAGGRLLTRGIRATDYGAADAAKALAHREGITHAYQAPTVQEFLKRREELPAEPTKAQRRRATLHESAALPRPNLRQAPGSEPVSIKRGGAVVEQRRSGNLFHSLGQTALDNRRRIKTQETLRRVMDVRQQVAEHPNMAHELIPQKDFASQLAFDVRRGEVAPLLQRGGRAHNMFVGAEKAQRIGASYGKGEKVRERRAVSDSYGQTFHDLLAKANPMQRKVLDFAKEGQINLHDPIKAQRWLQEIHDQAVLGADRMRIPLQHVKEGSSVARETGAVLDHIAKHGPESVFTPEFARLAELIPDERLVSPKDPVLQQNPDAAIARKYLPQIHMLRTWAERHPDHPDAPFTQYAADQIHHLLEEGHDLRQGALATGNADMHAKASDKFASAKNLADELAQKHGLPTDRAYIPHQQSIAQDSWLHTVGNVSPTDYKRWQGKLQAAGYRSTDAELILRATQKSLRNQYSMQNVLDFEKRFGVELPRNNMTAREAHDWLAQSGRNPDHFQVVHLGKLRQGMTDLGEAEHLLHLNSDPETHARAIERMWQQAGDTPLTDTTRGASIVPKAAFEEMRNSFRGKNAFGRITGKAKGEISKLILGLSLPWLTTMSSVTYPLQALLAGANPLDFPAYVKEYRSLNPVDKAHFDQRYGVDSPFRTTSHGMEAERLGSAMPRNLEGLARTMRIMRQSPMGRLLSHGNLVKRVIAAERVPRRYARIAVGMKGIKSEALRQIASDMQDGQKAINRFETGTQRLIHAGRMPAKKYIDRAMENVKAMEEVARHANNAMGEWHNMTNFERNQLSKYIMFYPWMRYSLKLAAHTLPAHHPLLYSAALKLGTWEHKNLTELLGTEPEPGNIYLGKAQPGVAPEKRQFSAIGIKQANPTINTALSAIAGEPSELLDVLPPYFAAAIEWAVNKSLFSNKPLKGPRIGESKEAKESPSLGPFLFEHNFVQPFGLLRTAEKIKTGGRPQAAESVPLIPGMEKPVQYSNRTERLLTKERKKAPPLGEKVLQELVPLVPHPAERLPLKIQTEKKEAKEEKKINREERHRREKAARKEKGAPQVAPQFLP